MVLKKWAGFHYPPFSYVIMLLLEKFGRRKESDQLSHCYICNSRRNRRYIFARWLFDLANGIQGPPDGIPRAMDGGGACIDLKILARISADIPWSRCKWGNRVYTKRYFISPYIGIGG